MYYFTIVIKEYVMNKTLVSIFLIIIALLCITGCNNDETTELAWINRTGAPINDIIWAAGDQYWVSATGGYNDGQTTEPKEISKLNGVVIASIEDGGNFVQGEAVIAETNSNFLTLNGGSSYVFSISDVIH